jgi:hypothetical protein
MTLSLWEGAARMLWTFDDYENLMETGKGSTSPSRMGGRDCLSSCQRVLCSGKVGTSLTVRSERTQERRNRQRHQSVPLANSQLLECL